ncbi:hypothetical protein MNB_SV-8-174 [hydrothermal vent metagenome]|uniref:Uncharacterized protein n=1 Tax=hydrothermal vent metagenome TaxID=652676 RepID=A0A1W1CAY9_9ZZZZ
MKKYYKYRKKKEQNTFIKILGNSSIVNIVASFGLFFGGLLFLSYYLYIGFMPSLNNFTDFTYMLFAMAIVGAFMFLILISLFVFHALSYDKLFDNEMKRIMDKKVFVYSMSIMPLIMIIYLIKETWLTEVDIIGWLFYGALLILGILIPSVVSKFFSDSINLSIKEKWERIAYVTIQVIISLYSTVIIYTIFVLSKQSNIVTNGDALVTFFLFSVAVIAVNTFILDDKYRKRLWFRWTIIVSVFIFLMLFFRTYSVVPSAVMNQFQLGNFMITSITAKHRTCKILSDINTSKFETSSIDTDDKTCVVKGEICILSSIGTVMLWQIDANRTIRLPSEDFSGMVRNTFDNNRCVVYR